MFTTVMEVNNLLRKADRGVKYISTNFNDLVNSTENLSTSLKRAKDTLDYLKQLNSDLLMDSLSNEVSTNFMGEHRKNLVGLLKITHQNVFYLWDSLKYPIVDTSIAETMDSLREYSEILIEIRLYATSEPTEDYKRPFYSIHHVIQQFFETEELYGRLDNDGANYEQPQLIEPGEKLQWNCKPAVAGYIISELIRKGYIEPPVTHGELSYAKLGAICNELFTVANHTPTPESWRKVLNPESSTLSDHKRAKLSLPDSNDLI